MRVHGAVVALEDGDSFFLSRASDPGRRPRRWASWESRVNKQRTMNTGPNENCHRRFVVYAAEYRVGRVHDALVEKTFGICDDNCAEK